MDLGRMFWAFTTTRRVGQTTQVGNELDDRKREKVRRYIDDNLGKDVRLIDAGEGRAVLLDVGAFSRTRFGCGSRCGRESWRKCCVGTVKNGWTPDDIGAVRLLLDQNAVPLRPEVAAELDRNGGEFTTGKLRKPLIRGGACAFLSSEMTCGVKAALRGAGGEWRFRPFSCNLFPSDVINLGADSGSFRFVTAVDKGNPVSLTRHGSSARMFAEPCLAHATELAYVYENEWLSFLLGRDGYLEGLRYVLDAAEGGPR